MSCLDVWFALSKINNTEDVGQDQRSFCATHPLMLVFTWAEYGKNSSRTVHAVEQTLQDEPYLAVCKFMTELPWRYRSKSKIIAPDTPSHAIDHLCQIGKESIQNCTCCSQPEMMCLILAVLLQVMAECPWKFRSRSKAVASATPSHANDHLCQIRKESIQNCRSYRAECRMDGQTCGQTDVQTCGQTDGWSAMSITHHHHKHHTVLCVWWWWWWWWGGGGIIITWTNKHSWPSTPVH